MCNIIENIKEEGELKFKIFINEISNHILITE